MYDSVQYTITLYIYVCVYFITAQLISQEPAEYAIAVADTAFKHMLTLSEDPSIMISFLNCFIPQLRDDPITEGMLC